MRHRRAVLAVPGVIDDQRPGRMRPGHRVLAQQPHPDLVDRVGVPGRLGQEVLQALGLAVLGAGHRLGVGQRGQGLVALAWGQQPGQVVPEPAALRQPGQHRVELGSVVLQGSWSGRAWPARGHLIPHSSTNMPFAKPLPATTHN